MLDYIIVKNTSPTSCLNHAIDPTRFNTAFITGKNRNSVVNLSMKK